ncbi:MAG: hypothetical protein C0P75_013150 [Bacilli bacterium]|uniref:Uncharacterized protein n=1 Tax=Ureibacillus suwonensis TaxID=313007 RepID=A0ABW0R8X1_9BACL|nr:hypothetical protein [Bacilli bacterium]
MYGSIFLNCWGSLITFSITFAIMYQVSIFPSQILLVSFFAALAAFILLFAVRYLIGYILYTPDDGLFEEFIEGTDENNSVQEEEDEILERDTNSLNQSSKMEFQDESSEEIAKLVRSMLSE